MAHLQQRFFVHAVRQLMPQYFDKRTVVEIGSLNLNGSVREFFNDCTYLGLDVGEGRDVDLICPGEHYGGLAKSVDVIISCEAMEHNPEWKRTWVNMLRLIKSDGLVIMTCATLGRRQHGTAEFLPSDSPLTTNQGQNYYCNLIAADFESIVNHDGWFAIWGFFQDHSSHDLYFFGVGHDADPDTLRKAAELRDALKNHYYRVNTLGIY